MLDLSSLRSDLKLRHKMQFLSAHILHSTSLEELTNKKLYIYMYLYYMYLKLRTRNCGETFQK